MSGTSAGVNLVGGTCQFLVDGTQYALRGNLKVSLGDVKRESVVGADGFHGIKEIPVASYIEAQVSDLAGLDIDTVQSLKNVTVNVKLNNGKTGVLSNASQMNQVELDAVDGSYTIRFEGSTGQWSA